MPKIITFTANLLAETTYEYSSWRESKTQRALGESFQVGGKGINVSKMLNRLNADNAAVCFPGGDFGPMCERWLKEAGIPVMPFRQGCVTRSGAVIRSKDAAETTFLGTDSVVSKEAVRDVVAALSSIGEPIVFAICGSVQNWDQPCWDPLRDWLAHRGEDAVLAVDNYGPSLPWFAAQRPDVVKFNRDELELLFDKSDHGKETPELLELAAAKHPCPTWVVTDGGHPIWVKHRSSAPEKIIPPEVDLVSPTGSGDVFFATLLDCLYNHDNYGLLRAARLAADYASRSAAMPGIAEFEL